MRGGDIARRFFRPGQKTAARTWTKDGGSPVTEADKAVDQFLHRELSALFPEAAWLSEETADDKKRLTNEYVWIVDPIDGTRAFMTGHSDWSLSIALIAGDAPVVGAIYAPVHDEYFEAFQGQGAFLNGTVLNPLPMPSEHPLRAAGPKFLVDQLQAGLTPSHGECLRVPPIPSLALRLARLAEGKIDAALVSTNACDWDIAAGHILLSETNGRLTERNGTAIRYNFPDPMHGELLAAAEPIHDRLVSAMLDKGPPGNAVSR